MNRPVNFELAKILKEKGFDELCDKKYIAQCLWQSLTIREKYKNSEIHQNSSDVVAPTIAEVVMWLYEKHGIWIEVLKLLDDTFSPFMQDVLLEFSVCKTPTEAYESGIEYVLKNLI